MPRYGRSLTGSVAKFDFWGKTQKSGVKNWRVLKLGGAETPKSYSDHAMAGKQLPCLGIAGDRGVAHVHHRVLDIGMPQPILHEGDIRASVQQMHGNRVAQRMKTPLGFRNGRDLAILLHQVPI